MSSTLQTHVILSSKNVLTQTESLPPSVPFMSCFRAFGATADIKELTWNYIWNHIANYSMTDELVKMQTFFFCNIPARFNLPFFHQLLFLQKEPQSDTKIPLFLRATVAWNSMFYHQLLLRWPKAWIDFLIFWKNNITKFYANDVNLITSLIFVVWEHLTYLTT